ncbi:MAG: hypothetical protein LBQ61_05265 [Spirochaetales bacterium]|nr:hypothetical protein [Spirochaetales bacterium]
MKKVVLFIIPLIIIMGCASGGRPAGAAGGDSPGIDLDAAIKEAAAQMEANLPRQTKIALVSVASSSVQLSEYIINRLEAALVGGRKLVVVDRANLDRIREEQGFQLSGEVSDESAKAIGQLLGAGAIVTGSFINLGDVYSLTLKAINMETAAIAASYPADVAKSTRIETLLAGGGAVRTVPPSPPAPAAPPQPPAPAAPPQPPAPAAPAPVYRVGDRGPAGGWVFYDMGFYMDGWRYLEAAPQDFPLSVKWTSAGIGTFSTETGVGTGRQNTSYLVSFLRDKGETTRAAQVVSVPGYGGYDDWFLPSRDELNLMYENLRRQRLGDFSNNAYWSSSGGITTGLDWNLVAWQVNFSDGAQTRVSCSVDASVRAIRRF